MDHPSLFFSTTVVQTAAIINQAILLLDIQQIPKIIIGLSGGPDSVYLLHILHELVKQKKIDLIAAHLDHQWRIESDNDARFCIQIAKKLAIPIIVKQASDMPIIKKNGSLEALGRALRRSFFETILREEKANFIALGHHLQDQQETFFLRIFRGTTLNGLHGMNFITPPYIRPLLKINKQDILTDLVTQAIPFIIDSTNTDTKFLRNKIRQHIVPTMQSCDTRFNHNFTMLVDALKEEDAFLQSLAEQSFKVIFKIHTHLYYLEGDLKKINMLHPVIKKRVIILWVISAKVNISISAALVNEINFFISSPRGGSHTINQYKKIYKKSTLCWIT